MGLGLGLLSGFGLRRLINVLGLGLKLWSGLRLKVIVWD